MDSVFLKNLGFKKSIKTIIVCCIVYIGFQPQSYAQEKLYPLFQNTVLQELNQPPHKVLNQHFKTVNPLKLPFFDDFSRYTGYPNDSLWLDNYVYINTGMGVNPPSTGVATFDGLNSYGLAYDPGSASGGQPADTLTSNFIDLSSYKEKDSIYLSFYYQRQGLGEMPDPEDSLILEIKPDSIPTQFDSSNNPIAWNNKEWIEVWSAGGGFQVAPFQEVLIPIKAKIDTNYFQGNFQFRFRNIANHSGNLDIWNVDYVLLDKGRTKMDTGSEDIAIYEPSNSIIKRYTSIPWKHYINDTTGYSTDSIHIYTHNNSSVSTTHVTFHYSVKSLSDNIILANSPAGVNNLNPNEFQDYTMKANITKNFIPKNSDSVVMSVKTIATNDASEAVKYRINDTATLIQNFNTYFAYDDGTAEQGYGISNDQYGGSVAVRFSTQMPDSLYGIGIHFNQSITDVSLDYFNLMVWSDIDTGNTSGKDDTLAQISEVFPQYVKHQNGFYYFPLAKPIAVGTTFYLGWSQISDFLLNVGFDRNFSLAKSGNDPILFFKQDGDWNKSGQQGVPMIRAFVGKKPVFAGIDNNDKANEAIKVELYPNPNNGSFTLGLPEDGKYKLELMDVNGKIISTQKNINGNVQIDASQYPSGVYIAHIMSQTTGDQVFKKVVVY